MTTASLRFRSSRLPSCAAQLSVGQTVAVIVKVSEVIDAAWSRLEPIRVGRVPATLATPDLFVTVEERGEPLLRVDVYSFGAECFAFQEAILWRDNVVVGFGGHVHAVSTKDHLAVSIPAEPYFCKLYPTEDYLLIASGSRLLRVEPDRSVLWAAKQISQV